MIRTIIKIGKYIYGLAIWLLSKKTLSNIMFGIQASEIIFKGNESKEISAARKKVKALVDRLIEIQETIDAEQMLTPNDKTKELAKLINEDKKVFGDFSAEMIPSKHGDNNAGINLRLKTKILGQELDLGYDPTDGSADFKIGELKFSL